MADANLDNRRLRTLITTGRASPSFIISHHLPLKQAPHAYEHFTGRDNAWAKVVLQPNG